MDETDEAIIRLLKDNSRRSNVDIAEELDVSEGTVRNRIKKLEDNGVIKRYTIEVSEKGAFRAFVLLNSDPSIFTENIVEKLTEVDGVQHAYELAGEWDLILDITAPHANAFNQVVESVRTTPGVRSTYTLTVLNAT